MNIAIVNDTAIAVEALRRVIASVPEYHLLWVARNGVEAISSCAEHRPDLILMDMTMPQLDGVAATRRIMEDSPCAILIVTASITLNTSKIFEAMGHGALDVVKTPTLGLSGNPQAAQGLLAKIATLARLIGKGQRTSSRPSVTPPPAPSRPRSPSSQPPLVVIGASTGGPSALQILLSRLPSAWPAALVIIQHIDAQFAPGLVAWLNQTSPLPVQLATLGSRPEAGKVLVAGTNDHLILRPNQTLRYTQDPRQNPHRPSVDVFFTSVAQHWSRPGVGVLLTGMGRDGAIGLGHLRSAGWHTIAESEESCVVYGMPKVAIDAGAASQVLPIGEISDAIQRQLTGYFPKR